MNINETNIHLLLQAELYRAFDFFNKHFKLKLPQPVIVLGVEILDKKRGHFSHDIWSSPNKIKKLHEIMVAGSLLASGAYAALATLIHEIAHMKNHEEKIGDCKNQRHNKKYAEMAEKLGLHCEFLSPQYGFARTTLRPETKELIKTEFKPDENLFKLFRLHYNELKKRKEKDKTKSLTPVMVGKDIKVLIEKGSKALGMTQKDFTANAANSYLKLPVRIKTAAVTLFDTNMSVSEIEQYLLRLLVEKTRGIVL